MEKKKGRGCNGSGRGGGGVICIKNTNLGEDVVDIYNTRIIGSITSRGDQSNVALNENKQT